MKTLLSITCGLLMLVPAAAAEPPAGFVSLFNGKDLSGWKVPAGDNGHWKVLNGVIDYDAKSEAEGQKHLWTAKEYGDFVLRIDWRFKATPFIYKRARIIMSDGSYKREESGKGIDYSIPDADSGILLRDGPQVNIWCWPAGSGELWQVRLKKDNPPEVRAAAVPKLHADKNIGEWNTFEITVKDSRATILLNGKLVIDNALMPGISPRGPIGLQHHGRWAEGEWKGPPSLVQFRNIFIKEL